MVTAALHQQDREISVTVVLTSERISPEDGLHNEEYFLVDLAEVYVRETVFKVSCNGTLHEFTKAEAGHWEYQRTEAQD